MREISCQEKFRLILLDKNELCDGTDDRGLDSGNWESLELEMGSPTLYAKSTQKDGATATPCAEVGMAPKARLPGRQVLDEAGEFLPPCFPVIGGEDSGAYVDKPGHHVEDGGRSPWLACAGAEAFFVQVAGHA